MPASLRYRGILANRAPFRGAAGQSVDLQTSICVWVSRVTGSVPAGASGGA